MSSTFSGLSGALSSLYAQRRGLDVTGQNIANANTDGYSRQRVDLKAAGGQINPATYAKSDATDGGVVVDSVTRVQDSFLETRGRLEHAQNTYLADQNSVYGRIEQAFGEPSDTGLQSQLADLSSAWHDLSNQPGNAAARSQVLGRATTITDTLHSTAATLSSLYSTTREQLDAYTTDINTSATQIGQFNQAIVLANGSGLPSNELADQRDKLVMHLSELTGATAVPRENGAVDVFVGGSSLVNGSNARQITASGATRLEDAGTSPVSLSWADNGTPASPDSGTVASMMQTLNTVLPSYSGQINHVANKLADTVNTQHEAGYDLNGDAGGPVFVSSDGTSLTAANITVAITDPNLLAAASTTNGSGSGTLDGGNADALGTLGDGTDSADVTYRQLVVNLGVAAQGADRRAGIQSSLTDDLDAARQAQSGVNLDEEMTNLMSYQRAYQAASRVITTIDSCLDTLINHTGS